MSLESLFAVPLQGYDIVDVETRSESISIAELAQLKTKIESNMVSLFDHLKLHRCDMDSSLLTPDGFPRSDIDVVQVRLARSKIRILQTDLKKVMALIEARLIEGFSVGGQVQRLHIDDKPVGISTANTAQRTTAEPVQTRLPFALVTDVIAQSPGDRAGLATGDRIVKIGQVDALNYGNSLTLVSKALQENQDVSINSFPSLVVYKY